VCSTQLHSYHKMHKSGRSRSIITLLPLADGIP
jgi:hypothetical protein